MSERFIKYLPNEKAAWLRQHHTALYLLISLAIERARWTVGTCELGLIQGDAILGDPSKAGISPKQYVSAIAKGVELGIWEKVYSRADAELSKGQKRTIKGTIKALVVNIKDPMCWDLNLNSEDNQKDKQRTSKGQVKDNKRRMNKNEEEKKECIKDDVRHCGNVHKSAIDEKPNHSTYEQSHNVQPSFKNFNSEKVESFPSEVEQCIQELVDFRFFCGKQISEEPRLRWLRSESLSSLDIIQAIKYYKKMESIKVKSGGYFDNPESYLEGIIKNRHWESDLSREKIKNREKQHKKQKEKYE